MEFEAYVLLPDHLHWILRPAGEDYSKLITTFKRGVLFDLRETGILGEPGSCWQPRFWEHTIRDDEDYERCVDYVHYNAFKHGWAKSSASWPYSSFKEFVKKGVYPGDWASNDDFEISGAEYD